MFPTAESIELVAPAHHGGLLQRAVWSFAGQAVSSGSNFLLSVLVLSVAQPDEFAVFSLCVVTYGTILQLTRASVAVPATLLAGGRSQQRAAIGVTVGLGIAAGAVVVLVGLLVGSGRSLLLPLGLLLPFLLFQDALRYACYAEGRPSAAAASDMAWLGLQVVASVVLLASGRGTATTLVVAWAVAGTVSGLAAGA